MLGLLEMYVFTTNLRRRWVHDLAKRVDPPPLNDRGQGFLTYTMDDTATAGSHESAHTWKKIQQ